MRLVNVVRATLCFGSMFFTASAIAAESQPDRFSKFAVHHFREPGEIGTYAYIVETAKHAILIDSGFSAKQGSRLRAAIDAVGKPVVAGVLTHAHPGHYGGFAAALEGRAPVIATSSVVKQYRDYDARFEEMTGGALDPNRAPPDVELADLQSFIIDNVKFTARELGPGESEADSIWIVEAGDDYVVFTGGVITFEVHPILTGRVFSWLESLSLLKQDMKPDAVIYPGYNPNLEVLASPKLGREALDWQESYLLHVLASVRDHIDDSARLTQLEMGEIQAELENAFPKNRAAVFIGLGLQPTATELALQQDLRDAEEQAKALFER